MVAFITEYAPQNVASERKNRARGFFLATPKTRRGDRFQTRHPRREKPDTATKTASGMSYYGFRFYSPGQGRFLNRDPIGEQGGANLYAFVGNDPVNDWDYLGLCGSWTIAHDSDQSFFEDQAADPVNPGKVDVRVSALLTESGAAGGADVQASFDGGIFTTESESLNSYVVLKCDEETGDINIHDIHNPPSVAGSKGRESWHVDSTVNASRIDEKRMRVEIEPVSRWRLEKATVGLGVPVPFTGREAKAELGDDGEGVTVVFYCKCN